MASYEAASPDEKRPGANATGQGGGSLILAGDSAEASLPQTIWVDSAIAAVALYSDQAVVTRRGSIQLEAGRHTLAFAPLPHTLQANSVTLTSRDRSLELLEVAVRPQIHSSAEAQTALLTDDLQTLEAAYHGAKNALTRLHLQRDFLQEMAQRSPRTFAVGLAQQQVGLEEAEALLSFLDRTYGELLDAIAQAESRKQALDQQLQAARQQLQLYRKAHTGYQVTACVEAVAPGVYEFELGYRVAGVCWQTYYQARLSTVEPALQLIRQGAVEQSSGEDWVEVSLVFYSGRFSRGPGDRPSDQTANSTVALSRSMAAERPRKLSRSPVLEDAYRMLGAVPGSEVAAIEEAMLSEAVDPVASPLPPLSFAPQGRYTVFQHDSSAPTEPTLVVLDQIDLACELVYQVLPQSSPHAYAQTACCAPTGGLLPGLVKLFRDGSYQGGSQIPACLPGQALTLPFGVDESVQVTQRLILHHRPLTFGGQETLEYDVLLVNQSSAPRFCQVKVQLPGSGQEQEVLTWADPPVQSSDLGEGCWELLLPPGAERKIRYRLTLGGESAVGASATLLPD